MSMVFQPLLRVVTWSPVIYFLIQPQQPFVFFALLKTFLCKKTQNYPLRYLHFFKNFNMHGHHKIHPLPPALSPHSLLTAWPASGYSKQTSGTVRGLSRISLLVTCLRVMCQPAHGTDFQPPSGFFWVSPFLRPIISDMIPFTCMSLLSLSPIVGISCLREPSFRKVSKSGGDVPAFRISFYQYPDPLHLPDRLYKRPFLLCLCQEAGGTAYFVPTPFIAIPFFHAVHLFISFHHLRLPWLKIFVFLHFFVILWHLLKIFYNFPIALELVPLYL